jgi:hypothetical protein
MTTTLTCVKCAQQIVTERRLVAPVFCDDCLDDVYQRSVERGRNLRWFDGPDAPVETPPDQHLRRINAPSLFD